MVCESKLRLLSSAIPMFLFNFFFFKLSTCFTVPQLMEMQFGEVQHVLKVPVITTCKYGSVIRVLKVCGVE